MEAYTGLIKEIEHCCRNPDKESWVIENREAENMCFGKKGGQVFALLLLK